MQDWGNLVSYPAFSWLQINLKQSKSNTQEKTGYSSHQNQTVWGAGLE
uniref:Uncharacterized protein n=1 Tax=Rhizophora mucronata TaxID=61149 RepID=A0A2P2PY72_RHIMU